LTTSLRNFLIHPLPSLEILPGPRGKIYLIWLFLNLYIIFRWMGFKYSTGRKKDRWRWEFIICKKNLFFFVNG
jgi:hypothetical protein